MQIINKLIDFVGLLISMMTFSKSWTKKVHSGRAQVLAVTPRGTLMPWKTNLCKDFSPSSMSWNPLKPSTLCSRTLEISHLGCCWPVLLLRTRPMQAPSWLNKLSTCTGYRFREGILKTAALNTFNSGLNRITWKYLWQHNWFTYINHIKGGFFSSEKKWQEKEVTTQQLLFYKNSKCII